MNILFQTRKPRRFHHEMIYVDERKERMNLLEERARQQLNIELSSSDEALRLRLHQAMKPSKSRLRLQHSCYIIAPALLILFLFAILLLIL